MSSKSDSQSNYVRKHKSKCKKKCIPCPIQPCKPEVIPMTLEISPLITLVVNKPEVCLVNNAVCKPSKKCHKSRSKSKCRSRSRSTSKSECRKSRSKCECEYYEEYYDYCCY